MAIKVIAWNIEKFGAFSALKKGTNGSTRIEGTLSAIADVVNAYGGDILVIQEFRNGGSKFLPKLQQYLAASGDTWSFDYVKGAFKQGTTKAADITGPNSLQYSATSNSEGYAVLWKTGLLEPFNGANEVKMSIGQNGDSTKNGYINLVLSGSGPDYLPMQMPMIGADGKGYASVTKFPRPSSPLIVNNPQANQSVLRFDVVRRPCLIKIVTQQYATVPAVVYHAPASSPSCLYAVWASSLVNQMGADLTKNIVIAGDLNLTLGSQFYSLSSLYGTLQLNNGTYSKTRGNEFNFSRSQIQYQQAFVSPPTLVDEDSTYEHPRDILFYRKTIQNPPAGVIDIVSDLQRPAAAVTKAITGDSKIQDAVRWAFEAAKKAYQFPAVVLGDADVTKDIKTALSGKSNVSFTSSLSAAVFYRCFISDHLPVYCQLT